LPHFSRGWTSLRLQPLKRLLPCYHCNFVTSIYCYYFYYLDTLLRRYFCSSGAFLKLNNGVSGLECREETAGLSSVGYLCLCYLCFFVWYLCYLVTSSVTSVSSDTSLSLFPCLLPCFVCCLCHLVTLLLLLLRLLYCLVTSFVFRITSVTLLPLLPLGYLTFEL